MLFPKTSKDWNNFSKVMIGLGIILVGIGAISSIRTLTFLNRAVLVTGEIIELAERKNFSRDILYAPVFTFRDRTGETHTVLSSIARALPAGDVGDRIAILYDPDNPKNAEVNSFVSIWGLSIIVGSLGVIFLVAFWVVAVVTKNKIDSATKNLIR